MGLYFKLHIDLNEYGTIVSNLRKTLRETEEFLKIVQHKELRKHYENYIKEQKALIEKFENLKSE